MQKLTILFLAICSLIAGCKQKTVVHPTFFYWKTIYQDKKVETDYLTRFNSNSLYVRIMDVDVDPNTLIPAPVSPIEFKDSLPKDVAIIPVVYLVNNVFSNIDSAQINVLATRIVKFVEAKVKQAGKASYTELQIDCDWTKSTSKKYFTFLRQLKANPLLKEKLVSVTLRLHQVRNISSNGIPPVSKALLMCYNMGNLRKYGEQNSILSLQEMDIYLKEHLEKYPLKLDVALPIFNWAVVFRNQQYAGLSKRVTKHLLSDKKIFRQRGNSLLFELLTDLPKAGLKKDDVIRWEEVSVNDLLTASGFLSRYLRPAERNLVFYHLDVDLLKQYSYENLQKVIADF